MPSLLLALLLAVQSPALNGRDVTTVLQPAEALVRIAGDLKGVPINSNVSEDRRSSISKTVNRIDWKRADERFDEFEKALLLKEPEREHFQALALILSAYDAHLSRSQIVPSASYLGCSDPDANLLVGELWPSHSPPPYYESGNWPWLKTAAGLELCKIASSAIYGNMPPMSSAIFLKYWKRPKRTVSKP